MIANWKFCVLCLLWCVISFSVAEEQNDEQKGTGITLGRQLVEEGEQIKFCVGFFNIKQKFYYKRKFRAPKK